MRKSSLCGGNILAAEGPAAEEGEVVDGLRAVLLDGHGEADGYPAGGLVGRNADRFIGRDARQSAHVLDIRLGVVLAGRRPLADNLANGKQPVLVVVRAGEQVEGGSPTILKRFKLAKTCIILLGSQALPLILASADIQRVIISDSSWYHNSKF